MSLQSIVRQSLICCMGVLLCLVSAVGPVRVGLADNAVIAIGNAGFEQTGSGGEIPGWRQTYGSGVAEVTYEVTDAAKYDGLYSLRLDDASVSSALGVESDKFSIAAGVAYSASAMVQVEREKLSIYLQFFNAEGARIANAAAAVDPTGGAWVKGGVSAIAPPGAVTASVLLYSASTTKGAGYFDDVKVEVNPIGTFEHLGQPIMNFIHQDSAIGMEQGTLVSYTVVKGANDSTAFAVVDLLRAEVVKTIPIPGSFDPLGQLSGSEVYRLERPAVARLHARHRRRKRKVYAVQHADRTPFDVQDRQLWRSCADTKPAYRV